MTDQRTPENNTQNIAEAIQEVSERAQMLVREEIELAKAEVSAKLSKLVKGAVVGMAAGIFVVGGMFIVLHGLAWLAWYELFPDNQFFWGFFVVAAVLFLLGALAGFMAARAFKAGAPPTPKLAIDEAKRIRETVQSSQPERTV
jgi:hypothetical protein